MEVAERACSGSELDRGIWKINSPPCGRSAVAATCLGPLRRGHWRQCTLPQSLERALLDMNGTALELVRSPAAMSTIKLTMTLPG